MKNIYKKGSIIKVKVTAIKHYGAFIETRDKVQGLIHISEIANSFIVDINYYLREGDIIEVKILSVVDGKINATLNFNNKKDDSSSNHLKNNKIKYCNFKHGFKTIKNQLPYWKKEAINFIKYSKNS